MKKTSPFREKLSHIQIPHARMRFPRTFLDTLKYIFWVLYTPIHPYGRDLFLKLHILKHNFRQPFLIGKIDIDASLDKVVAALVKAGYGNHFVAWEDTGEAVSLRKVENFVHQYHIRIFDDGEVRGHYEYTPECHPVWHAKEIGMEDKTDAFRKIIGAYLIKESKNIKTEIPSPVHVDAPKETSAVI